MLTPYPLPRGMSVLLAFLYPYPLRIGEGSAIYWSFWMAIICTIPRAGVE